MTLVAGIDSGTQSTKVELRDIETGRIVASGRGSHQPATPPRSEQDPSSWWDALVSALRQCGDRVAAVDAVAVAAQQHGLVVLDSSDQPLRPAKLWNDTTSAPQAASLVERIGAPRWAQACGSVPVPAFTVTKLAWLVELEPALADGIARIALPHDYLTLRLTGQHVTDRGDASGTGWFDAAAGRYRADLLELVGGRSGDDWATTLPRVVPFGAVAGTVNLEAASATGLAEGTPVAAGTGDNMGAALGMGLGRGDIAMSLGTSGAVYAVSDSPTRDGSGAVAGFCDATEFYLPLVCTLNATRVTDTVASWLNASQDELAVAALRSAPGAGGVTLVPYFDGERTPNLPNATGSLGGLTNSTHADDLARAAHEGVVCSLLDGVDALNAAGATAHGRLHLVGGGAHSRAFRQITADCWGSSVYVPAIAEAVAAGACVAAAALLGISPQDAAAQWGLNAGDEVSPTIGAAAPEVRAGYRRAAEGR